MREGATFSHMPVRWVHFRVDEDLYRRMREAAAADHRSLSNWLALIVERALNADPENESRKDSGR